MYCAHFVRMTSTGTLRASAPLIHPPMVGAALLVVCLLGDDLIAEKAGGGRARMGDQGFLFREGQLQRVAEERLELAFDGFGFRAWPTEPEQPIVGITHVP
jgi:hypothetical protein